jgi:hypothetical protein
MCVSQCVGLNNNIPGPMGLLSGTDGADGGGGGGGATDIGDCFGGGREGSSPADDDIFDC